MGAEGSHSGSSICGEDAERDGCCAQLTDSFCAVEDTFQGMVPPRVDASSHIISLVMITPQEWPKSVSPGTLDLSKLPAKTVITPTIQCRLFS